jgi:hypothetical protein
MTIPANAQPGLLSISPITGGPEISDALFTVTGSPGNSSQPLQQSPGGQSGSMQPGQGNVSSPEQTPTNTTTPVPVIEPTPTLTATPAPTPTPTLAPTASSTPTPSQAPNVAYPQEYQLAKLISDLLLMPERLGLSGPALSFTEGAQIGICGAYEDARITNPAAAANLKPLCEKILEPRIAQKCNGFHPDNPVLQSSCVALFKRLVGI